MKFRAYLDGKEHFIEFEEKNKTLMVKLNGKLRKVDARRLEPSGLFSLLIDGKPFEAQAEGEGQQVIVKIREHSFDVSIAEEHRFRKKAMKETAQREEEQRILAPMPGLIVSLKVKPGDNVESGQPVVVIEAMKMQNELLSKIRGIVKEVRTSEEEKVDSGQVLVVISPVVPLP